MQQFKFGLLTSIGLFCAPALGVTGTFLDRELPTDVRVVTYNILNDAIFADTNAVRAERFARIAPAVNADVWVLQELSAHTATDVQNLFNTIAPLPGGASWNVFKSTTGLQEYVFVSRYSMTGLRSNIVPSGPKHTATSLIDLPNATYAKDLYLMNVHFKAFNGAANEQQRLDHADAVVNWERDARTAGGSVNLASGTPMVVLGDMNLVDGLTPLDTLMTGNILNTATYGAPSAPDWDGSAAKDVFATHNNDGATTWTWREDGSGFDPSRLDAVVYTDSVIGAPHSFILNTVTMTANDRAATGLQQYDVTLDNVGNNFDHLPIITDFRFGNRRTLVWNPPGTNWDSIEANWLNGSGSATFAEGDVVRFTDAGVGTVTIRAGGLAPGAIRVTNNSGTYFIAGGTIGGACSLVKGGTGTLILGSANSFTGGTTVASGTLVIGHERAVRGGTLSILDSARVKASPGLTAPVFVKGLSIAAGGQMDLADDDLVVDYTGSSPLNSVIGMIADARLMSSLGSANRGLGYADTATFAVGTFGGAAVDATSILVKYTYFGDANLDGQVDINDLASLATSWQTSGVWTSGDFDRSGFIDIIDLARLATNWQAGVGAPLSMTFEQALASVGLGGMSVPEPAALAGLLASVLVIASPRTRRR